jgi:hypothetical protein
VKTIGPIALGLALIEHADLRSVRQVAPEGVHVDWTESPGESELLLGLERLIPEEESVMVEHQLANRREALVGERLAQVDPGDLGTDVGRQFCDREFHFASLRRA